MPLQFQQLCAPKASVEALIDGNNSKWSLQDVLFWYYFMYGTLAPSPTVIMEVAELKAGQDAADVHSATRSVARLGINVIVDASSNSLGRNVLETLRQQVIYFHPIGAEDARQEFKVLFNIFREVGLQEVVEKIIGGNQSKQLVCKVFGFYTF